MAGRKKKVTTTTTVTVTEEVVNATPSITRVALVIDRSGSMNSVRAETLGGINAQLETLKKTAKLGGETFVSYIQFDDVIETVFANKRAEELVPLTEDQYVPRGWTALYDATLRAISTLKQESDPADAAYLVVVVTDGADNKSSETNQYKLGQMIKEYEAKGNWSFTYLLANLDARQFAQALNVNFNNVASYDGTKGGTRRGFMASAASLSTYMTTRGATGATQTTNFYAPVDATVTGPLATAAASGSLVTP